MPAMDPYSAAFGAIASVATPAPAGPSEAKSSGSIGGGLVDNSGWNITFGNDSGIAATRSQAEDTAPPVLQYALYAGAFLLAWKYLKKH